MKKLIVIIGLLMISVLPVQAQQENNQVVPTTPPFHQLQQPPALPTEKSTSVSRDELAGWHVDALTQHDNPPSPQAEHHHEVVILQDGQQENQQQPTARRLFGDEEDAE